MARLDFALLALAATEEGDLFNLLRAGVEQLTVSSLPLTTLLHLAARWDWEDHERTGTQTIGVSCRDPQGSPLHEATYELQRDDEPGYTPAGRIVAMLPLTIQRHGVHHVELTVNRAQLKRIPVVVIAG